MNSTDVEFFGAKVGSITVEHRGGDDWYRVNLLDGSLLGYFDSHADAEDALAKVVNDYFNRDHLTIFDLRAIVS